MTKDQIAAAKIAEAIMKIMRGEAKPYVFRPSPAPDSASYRAAMIDAGRGRLLR